MYKEGEQMMNSISKLYTVEFNRQQKQNQANRNKLGFAHSTITQNMNKLKNITERNRHVELGLDQAQLIKIIEQVPVKRKILVKDYLTPLTL